MLLSDVKQDPIITLTILKTKTSPGITFKLNTLGVDQYYSTLLQRESFLRDNLHKILVEWEFEEEITEENVRKLIDDSPLLCSDLLGAIIMANQKAMNELSETISTLKKR